MEDSRHCPFDSRGAREYTGMRVYRRSGAMLNKIAIFATAVILAAPICTAAGGSSSAGGNPTAGSAGGHSGGGGDAGHGSGAHAGVAHSGGLSGGAAATARSVAHGRELSSREGISHSDAMHATHLPSVNHSEHPSSKPPSMDHHNGCYSLRCEPKYRAPFNQQLISEWCVPRADVNNNWSWFDCNGPTKSQSGHK